jgi:hypothetical protein
MGLLEGRVAIVTGGAGNLGAHIYSGPSTSRTHEWDGVISSHLKGTPYCAAKAGVIGLMRAITVCPAGVEGVHGPIADRLVGPSANVAPLVAYFASEQAGWINGHVFDISGSGRLGCSSRCTRASPVSGRGCCRPPVSNSTSYPRAFRRCCTKCFPPQGFSRHPRPRRVLRGVEGR